MDRPDEGAVLDRRTLNRTLLARQLLLERSDQSPGDVVGRLMGMQAQVPLDPYVGLWSRVQGFDPDAFGELLLERELVRMTLMRSTLHLVGAPDALRMRPVLQGMLERAFASSPFARNLTDLDLEPVLRRGVELVEHEPMTTAELRAELAHDWPRHDAQSLAYAVRYLVPLVQVTPRGVWGRSLQAKLTTLENWLGRSPAVAPDVERLVLGYLGAFGPASPADLRAWSWLSDARSIVERLRPQLRLYRDEAGRELFDVADGDFCDGTVAAPVRFLPQYDNVFLAHADRGRIMDRVVWGPAFTHRGTVLVDGFIAAAWKLWRDRNEAVLAVELLVDVSRTQRGELEAEAAELLTFLAPDTVVRRLEMASG